MIICLIILCIMLAVIISANIKIVPQAHSYIIERFTISHFPVIKQAPSHMSVSIPYVRELMNVTLHPHPRLLDPHGWKIRSGYWSFQISEAVQ